MKKGNSINNKQTDNISDLSIGSYWFQLDELYKITQYIIRILSRMIMIFFYRLKIKHSNKIEDVTKPVLIVSNHKSYFDPLIISDSLPLNLKVYPLRYIAKDQLFRNPLSKAFFISIGCFPVFYGSSKDKSLEIPSKVLRNKGAVVFFPEAKCIRDDTLADPKIGVGILALRYPNVPILPLAIHGSHKVGKLGIFDRTFVSTSVGEQFYLKDKMDLDTATPELASRIIMNEIAALYESLSVRRPEKVKIYQT